MLYRVNLAYLDLMEKFSNEEITEAEFHEKIEALDETLTERVEGTVKFIKELESRQKAYKEEEESFKAKKIAAGKKIEVLKNNIQMAMNIANVSSVETDLFKVGERTYKSVEADLDILDPAYIKVKTEKSPDKKMIASILKEGKKVEGAKFVESKKINIK